MVHTLRCQAPIETDVLELCPGAYVDGLVVVLGCSAVRITSHLLKVRCEVHCDGLCHSKEDEC